MSAPRYQHMLRLLARTVLLAAAMGSAHSAVASTFVPGPAGFGFVHGTWQTHLAVDAEGVQHVVFNDYFTHKLRYAVRRPDGWLEEDISTSPGVGLAAALALDASGKPHVAYIESLGVSNQVVKYATLVAQQWVSQQASTFTNVVQGLAIAIGPDQSPVIAFRRADKSVNRAQLVGGAWTTGVDLIASKSVGRNLAMAVDRTGLRHYAYSNDALGTMNYSRISLTGTADDTTLASGSSIGLSPSIVVDQEDHVRVAYGKAGDLVYAEKLTSFWSTQETVDGLSSTDVLATVSSLAVDANGLASIAYYDSTHKDLRFAVRQAPGTWSTEAIVTTGSVGAGCSLALDPEGNPIISYLDSTRTQAWIADAGVRLITPRGGEQWVAGSRQLVLWSGIGPVDIEVSLDGGLTFTAIETGITDNAHQIQVPLAATDHARLRVVRQSPLSSSSSRDFVIGTSTTQDWWSVVADSTGRLNISSAVALDSHDVPRMVAYDPGNNLVRYEFRSGGRWIAENVNASGKAGTNLNLAMSRDGEPMVAYYDQGTTHKDVRFARRIAGAWQDAAVDSLDAVGTGLVMTLDGAGNPHLAYYDATTLHLRHATRVGTGPWSIENIGTETSTGSQCDIAVSRDGRVHVVYQNAAQLHVRYAVRSLSGVWQVSTVDTLLPSATRPSLALDARELPSVLYGVDSTPKVARLQPNGTWNILRADALTGVSARYAIDSEGNQIAVVNGFSLLEVFRESGGAWLPSVLDDTWPVIQDMSTALDSHGRVHVAILDGSPREDLYYGSEAVELSSPEPGASWPVGARREIHWDGAGLVDVSLSTDGGASYSLLGSSISGQSFRLTVPNTASSTCKVKVERALLRSVAVSDSFFAITGGVFLMAFRVEPSLATSGARLQWQSEPALEDLAGYRIERRDPGGGWQVLENLLHGVSYEDAKGVMGSEYRLTAVNGLGEEFALGEAALVPATMLSAWPSPFQAGVLNVAFYTDGSQRGVEVGLFDVAGRKVAELAHGPYPAGAHHVEWNGRDRAGRTVNPGLYFVRSENTGHDKTLKLILIQ